MPGKHESTEKKHATWWVNGILLVFGALFTGFAWYATNPKTLVAQVSTVSFGFGLVVLIGLLAYLDDRPFTRVGRFAVDLLVGLAIVALMYVFMIGITVYWQVMAIAGGIVLLLAALFAIRKPVKAKPHRLTRDLDEPEDENPAE